MERTFRVLPSSRVFRIEVYRQEDDSDDVMVLQNKEHIDWTAGDRIENLRFRLFDEGERQVALTQKIAQNVKVDVCVFLHFALYTRERAVKVLKGVNDMNVWFR